MRFILYLTIQISQINNGALLRYLLRKSMDWFLYDNGLRHERVKSQISVTTVGFELQIFCKLSSYLTHLTIRPNRLGKFGVPEIHQLSTGAADLCWLMLRYFNFEPSFKLRWCRAEDLFRSQISVTTGGFEMRISYIRNIAHDCSNTYSDYSWFLVWKFEIYCLNIFI